MIAMLNCRNFSFEGHSAEDYNVFLAYIGDPGVTTDSLYTAEIVETRIPSQVKPIFFGLNHNQPIERELTICSEEYLTREQIDEIVQWLTCSTTGYGELTVEDEELESYTLRVIFETLELVSSAYPIAIQCKVVCDSQYAYSTCVSPSYDVQDGLVHLVGGGERSYITVDNNSSYLGYIYPTLTLKIPQGVTQFSMTNTSDNNGLLALELPSSFTPDNETDTHLIIKIDTQYKIMTTNCSDVNPYKCLKDMDGYFYFPRLVRGLNKFTFEGTAICSLTYTELKGVGL